MSQNLKRVVNRPYRLIDPFDPGILVHFPPRRNENPCLKILSVSPKNKIPIIPA